VLGARWDRDGIDYDESYPTAGNDDSVTWSELSLRAGANWSPSERLDMYVSYGEAFLPPTIEQLFSYPDFGSTTDLRPEISRSYEYGVRYRRSEAVRLDAALFLTDTVDEIVFTFTDPDYPFGINANVGETRRMGIEASLGGMIAERLRYYINATLIDAEFRNGENRGRDVPLVPGERFAAGMDLELPGSVDLQAELLYTGDQVLDSDEANALPPLDSYTVLNARASWALPRLEEVEILLEITNLLDREYAVRGIYAYDFITEQFDDFYTPAPGRRFRAGVRWDF
jgi:outer membrane receptor protein involved in Fe transport